MKMNLFVDITDMPDEMKLKMEGKDIIVTPDGKSYMSVMANVTPSSLKIKFLDPSKP